jgi:serine/threonine-protein kinase
MATVHLAVQTGAAGCSRLAAVKRIKPSLASYREYRTMFVQEARIAASMNHPNLVQVFEVGEDANGYFLAMEYLRGQTYAQVRNRIGLASLSYRFSVEVLLSILKALEYAHALHDLSGEPMAVVHRDVSPSNVFIGYDGTVKLMDFGVAKTSNALVKTMPGVLKGKLAFMSPEQISGGVIDVRADLYAVGVMLWEATARRKFIEETANTDTVTELRKRLNVESPRAVGCELPQLAEEICMRALAPEPSQRYASATDFYRDLLQLAVVVGGRFPQEAVADYVSRRFDTERTDEQRAIRAELGKLDGEIGLPERSQTRLKVSQQFAPYAMREIETAKFQLTAANAPSVTIAPSPPWRARQTQPNRKLVSRRVSMPTTYWKLIVASALAVITLFILAIHAQSSSTGEQDVARQSAKRTPPPAPVPSMPGTTPTFGEDPQMELIITAPAALDNLQEPSVPGGDLTPRRGRDRGKRAERAANSESLKLDIGDPW